MKQLKIWLAVLPLMLMLAGCSADKEAMITGTWKASPTAMMAKVIPQSEGMTPEQSRQMGQMLGSIRVNMNEDKTFDISAGIPAQAVWKGTWSFDKESEVATFTPQPLATGAPKPEPFTGKIDDDTSRFVIDTSGGKGGGGAMDELVLEKE